jgi:hypothetical protein
MSHPFFQNSPQVLLDKGDEIVQALPAKSSDQAFAKAFACGVRNGVPHLCASFPKDAQWFEASLEFRSACLEKPDRFVRQDIQAVDLPEVGTNSFNSSAMIPWLVTHKGSSGSYCWAGRQDLPDV